MKQRLLIRRILLLLLALAVALSLFGCAGNKKPAHSAKHDDETERSERHGDETERTAATEDETARDKKTEGGADWFSERGGEGTWSYSLRIEETFEEYTTDGGAVLATGSFERPVLELINDDGATEGTPPAELQRVCNSFNDFFDTIYSIPEDDERYAYCTVAGLGKAAEEWYNAMDADAHEYFYAYFYNIEVPVSRLEGDLVEIELMTSVYCGGAHGGSGKAGYHFDLKTGEFFTLADLTDDMAGLGGTLADEILRIIAESGEADYYFSGYEDTVRNYGNYNFSLGSSALTVIFGEYEIGPYAMGIQTFAVSYDVIAPFLNARGERLLGQ
ncbi:MAG: DUF3298 domain-containing protein [Oscillospiraceae bacterium]|nr:DUF3298 domain-containing protein [Oscillospiraceae bacterium]